MINNLLITTLSSIPRKKVTRFKEFALSPYFNKHVDVANLAVYLSDIYPNFSEKKCHRETIFKVLYPTLSHDQQKLAIVFTYSMRLLEDFFRMEESILQGALQDNSLLTAQLRENDLLFLMKKYLEENYKGGNKSIGNFPFEISASISALQKTKEQDLLAIRLEKFDTPHLHRRQAMLDAFYLSEKLKDACELLQRGKMLNRDFHPTPLFEAVTQWLGSSENAILHNSPIALFFKLYTLLKTNDETLYESFLIDLAAVETMFSQEELKMIYSHLQNFCIGQINAGKKQFLDNLFQIYRSQTERDLLLVNGILPEWHFKNIVTTALRLDEHEWAKDFIEKDKEKLRADVRENAYSYNLAAYHYHLGHLEEVLKLLVQVEYTDLRYNLDAKSLLLRTYYDLEEQEALISLTDAFRQYLKRNKELTNFQKTGYYNLLKFTRSAFRLKLNKGFVSPSKWQISLDKLKRDILGAETVFNLSWLQGKINDL